MEKVTAYKCYGIFGDFDGHAPDTENLVLCATKELAERGCELFRLYEKVDDDTTMIDGVEYTIVDMSIPYVQGYEWCKHYYIREAICEHLDKIATNEEELFEALNIHRV